MPKLIWDQVGERLYETGVSNGVLFVYDSETGAYGPGVAWNGLTSVNESPSGAEENPQYADNIKYLGIRSAEEFGATIEAFTYPSEFEACDGTASLATGVTIGQQPRKMFAFSYKTVLGNDVDFNDYGYKLHIVYGCTASPSEKAYSTINDSPEAMTMSWEVSSTPVAVEGHKPTAQVTVNSKTVASEVLKKIEDALYGTEAEASKLPTMDELLAMINPEMP